MTLATFAAGIVLLTLAAHTAPAAALHGAFVTGLAAVGALASPRTRLLRPHHTCNRRKLGKPQILCFGFLLITPCHGFSRAFEGA